jgi:hypothetical protein
VSVTQTEPDVSLQIEPSEVRFNETVTVAGRVSIEDIGAGNVPYLVTLGGQFIAQNTTAPDGTFDDEFSLPSSAATGDQEVRVSLLLTDQALASVNTSTSITVEESPSNLTLSVDAVEGRSVQVSGRLSVSEFSVRGQRVRLVAANTTLGTVTTGMDGQFQTTLVIPPRLLDDGLFDDSTTVSIQAEYRTARSNIESAQASTTVSITHTSRLPVIGAVVIGGGILLIGGYLVYSRFRETDASSAERLGPGGTGQPAEQWQSLADSSEIEPLTEAQEALAANQPEVAVQYGYAAVRMQLERQTGLEAAKTPWEFYRAYREHDTSTEINETLRQATELYERAVFASETVPSPAAEELLSRLDGTEPMTSSAP